MKRYGLKGINDEATECSVCGKIELKRVMWLVELAEDGSELGEVFPVGTTCGAKLLGYSAAKMRKNADNFAGTVTHRRNQMAEWRLRQNGGDKLIDELNSSTHMISYAERMSHPLMIEFKRLQAEAYEWSKTQPVVIAL